jgi:glycosyltransferase involved in cell wall biosynthesis
MSAELTAAGRPSLSIIILAYNEEANLPACLASLEVLAPEIFVVDSGSGDQTRAIAVRCGATVIEHAFETHAKQWKWALENTPISTEWILALDADQRLTAKLTQEISDVLRESAKGQRGVDGFYIKRRQVFRGRWIRHGGYYPKYLLKLFRYGKVLIDERELVDHHFYVGGPVAKLRYDLIEENQKENDISFWIEKHVRYASLLARQEFEGQNGKRGNLIEPSMRGNLDQRTLWLKRFWSRLPLYVRSFLYFIYRYVFRLGFLDGKEGFVFHFLHAFWFRVLVDIKLEEMRWKGRQSVGAPTEDVTTTTGRVER